MINVTGQPVAYPPSQSHHAGSVYINKSYDSGSKDRGRRVPNQELIVIDYADNHGRDNANIVRDPVQLGKSSLKSILAVNFQNSAPVGSK